MANKELLIDNPIAWATANRYSLYRVDGGFGVGYQDKVVGKLVEVAGGSYKFVNMGAVINGIQPTPNSQLAGITPVADLDSVSSVSSNPLEPYLSKSFFTQDLLKPVELFNVVKKGDQHLELGADISGTGQVERTADCNTWLPFASKPYCLSPDLRDYILVPAPAIFSDLPNTNGDSLSLSEMLKFDPTMGMQMYKTFKGKPCHQEHANKDITKAKGIILDSFMRPITKLGNGKYWKMVHLYAFDRTKDPILAQAILNGESNAYSIGFYYTSYTCSICGTRVGKGINTTPCSHTFMGKPTYRMPNGRLVYRQCENATGFESSSVNSPAFSLNQSSIVYDASKV